MNDRVSILIKSFVTRYNYRRARRRVLKYLYRELCLEVERLSEKCEWNTYPNESHSEPCWAFRAPWGKETDLMLIRPSRMILISKRTGQILYDGSANDEG